MIATGKTHSVQELLSTAFSCVGLDWERYVEIDRKLVRPAEVEYLCGDSTKAARVLGWRAEVDFHQLVTMMVEADLNSLKMSRRSYASVAGA